MSPATVETPGSFKIELETYVDAPREKVFDAMTIDITKWFPHRTIPGSEVLYEHALLGRSAEIWGENQGALWAINTVIQKPETFCAVFPGGIFGNYFSIHRYVFEEKDAGTLMKVSVYAVGEISAENADMFDSGFPALFDLLRQFVAKS